MQINILTILSMSMHSTNTPRDKYMDANLQNFLNCSFFLSLAKVSMLVVVSEV